MDPQTPTASVSLSGIPPAGGEDSLRATLATALEELETERAARLRAEAALADRERMVADVEQLGHLGTWEWNLPSDVITWSSEQMRIHGMEPGANTQSFADFVQRVHPDDRARVVEECERLVAGSEPFSFPYRVVRPDGSVRELLALGKMLPSPDGAGQRMVGISQDVTERNAADRALRASETRFRDLFDQFPHSVKVYAPDGRVVRVNAAYRRLWGLSMDDVADFNPLLAAGDTDGIGALVRRAFAGETAVLPPVLFDPRDYSPHITPPADLTWPRWVQASYFPIRSPEGEVTEVVAVHQDVTDQRAAEEALRVSEESYRTIFERSNDAIFVSDPGTGQMVDANARACEMCDTTLDEIRADPASILWNGPEPYTPERALEQNRRAAAGEAQRFEWMSIHPRSGAEIWGEVSLQRVTLAGQLRVLALVRDIGERKTAERALRASEESYRTIFELSNDAIYVHDVETGFILDANRRACEAAGMTLDEVRSRGMQVIAGGPEPYTLEKALEHVRLAAAGEPQRFEWMTGAAEGQVWSEVSLNRVTIGGADRLVATARDITERKRAERELRDREESYRTIFDSAGAGLWVHDLQTGAFLDVNQTACDLYGWTVEEQKEIGVAGLSWGEPPYTAAEAAAYVERAIAGEPQRFEWKGRHRDGHPVWAEITLRRLCILGEDRLLATGRETSEWKAAEEELVRANQELERRVEERTAELAETNEALEEEVAEHEAAREELLQRSHELEGVFNALPDLYFRLDPDGTITDHRAGPGAAMYSPLPDFRGRRMQDLLPPEAAARFQAALEKVCCSGDLECVEYELEGGVRGPTAYEARLLPLPDGTRITVVRDVTERKQAEAEIVRQKAFFEEVIGSMENGVAVFDLEGRFVYASSNTVRDPELRAWAIGHTIEEYGARRGLPPEVVRQRGEGVRAAGARGVPTEFEEKIGTPAGGTRHMLRRCLPMRGENGDVVRVIGYSVDITERVRMAEALRQSEEHFRALIENAHDITCILDPAGVVQYQSPSMTRLLGWEPDEMLGRSAWDFLHPDDVERVAAETAGIVAEPGASRTVEYRIRHRDGGWRRVEAIGRTLDPTAAEHGVVANLRDVTERWEAEEALRGATLAAERARAEAERANHAKSEFLSRMSHELRTPMNSILGFGQVLARGELRAEQQRHVQHILKAGRHLLRLINEVLEIARIEAGREGFSLEPVHVGTVLQEAVGLVRPMAEQHGVRVDEAAPAVQDAFVYADRQRLTQVLLNLLSNAIKYNHPGGGVRLTCELVPAADGGEARAWLRVEDTGSGIPAERAHQLFTPFARLGAEQTEVEGTGLGLALSLRLAEAMGGTLELERTGPDGSVFRLGLLGALNPLRRAEDAGIPALRDEQAHAYPPATLLYVEDNLANLSLVETFLMMRPAWRLVPALQGQIGVELAREHRPDLVLLDLHLPDISGEEVLRRLRADERTAGIPVIIISADATLDSVDRLRAAGADAYLTKPLDLDDFLDALQAHLPAREAGA